ncbi:cytidine deaminase [Paenibacillus sp. 1P07SE]
MDSSEAAELQAAAVSARDRAYAPYSNFQVGAALLDDQGRVHAGCNVENAAYGPTNCAERTALFRAIADGARPGAFRGIAVVGDTPSPIAPCGVCRQVMIELCPPDMPVWMGNIHGQWQRSTVAELLPGAFVLVREEPAPPQPTHNQDKGGV